MHAAQRPVRAAAARDGEAEQDAVAAENLAFAAAAAGKAGASVLVEAINSVDIPGFPVDSSDKAMAVIAKTAAPNVGFLADLYHLAKMGEDVADVLGRYREAILHVQVADSPGRGAPGTGATDFEPLFARLAAQGYDGWVGLEYLPPDGGDSAASFGVAARGGRAVSETLLIRSRRMVVGDEVLQAAAFVRDHRVEAIGDYDLQVDADRDRRPR